jgi:hypothetical protein
VLLLVGARVLDQIMVLDAKIGEFTEGHLLKRAKEIVEEKTKDSNVLDRAVEDRMPKIHQKGM